MNADNKKAPDFFGRFVFTGVCFWIRGSIAGAIYRLLTNFHVATLAGLNIRLGGRVEAARMSFDVQGLARLGGDWFGVR